MMASNSIKGKCVVNTFPVALERNRMDPSSVKTRTRDTNPGLSINSNFLTGELEETRARLIYKP